MENLFATKILNIMTLLFLASSSISMIITCWQRPHQISSQCN